MLDILEISQRSWIQVGKGTEDWNIEPSNTFYVCHWQSRCPSRGLPSFTEWFMHLLSSPFPFRSLPCIPIHGVRTYESRSDNEKREQTSFKPNLTQLRCARASARKKKQQSFGPQSTAKISYFWEYLLQVLGWQYFSLNIPAIRLRLQRTKLLHSKIAIMNIRDVQSWAHLAYAFRIPDRD